MLHTRRYLAIVASISLESQGVEAQISAAPIPSVLPSVSNISVSNATGVLRYCEQKGLVSDVATDSVIGALASKPDAKSADYLAGASGQILGDDGKKFSVGEVPGYLQSKACDMVLERAKAFAPRL